MPNRREFLAQLTAAGAVSVTPLPVWNAEGKHATQAPPTVNTVLGPIHASKLGFTLPHEHVFASSAAFMRVWPEYFGGRAIFVNKVVDKLKAAKDAGVDTIVDVTTVDTGRDIRLLQEVSRKSGVQIVACTGHWLDPSLSMSARTADELAEFFTLEITRGIEDTGIKPGVIKVATDRDGVTPFLEKALRAAARASRNTGIPVTTHTFAAQRGGEKQAEIFEAEGLSPSRVCLGHSDETNDVAYLTGLAKRGYTLGMDHFPTGARGIPTLLTWEQRAQCMHELIVAGFVDRLFLSNDWYFAASIAGTGAMAIIEKSNPDGMLFAKRKTIPYLQRLGVTDAQLRAITVENPRRFFGV